MLSRVEVLELLRDELVARVQETGNDSAVAALSKELRAVVEELESLGCGVSNDSVAGSAVEKLLKVVK